MHSEKTMTIALYDCTIEKPLWFFQARVQELSVSGREYFFFFLPDGQCVCTIKQLTDMGPHLLMQTPDGYVIDHGCPNAYLLDLGKSVIIASEGTYLFGKHLAVLHQCYCIEDVKRILRMDLQEAA